MTDIADDPKAEVEATIQEFVRTNLAEDFRGEDPLAEITFDSLALEQLIDFLEEKYLILLDAEDFARPNFASVPIAAAMIESRRRATELERQRYLEAQQADQPGVRPAI